MQQLEVQSGRRSEFIDITARVQSAVDALRVSDGVVTVFVPHTTAGVTINEHADPDVARDILHRLDALVPWEDSAYRHAEGNSAAHVKTLMTGSSVRVPVAAGRLQLGTWQGIFFCEYDGPRRREVWVQAG